MLDKDFFLVSEGVWKFLSSRYKGEEIKRYAIYKNQAGILERSPYLPLVCTNPLFLTFYRFKYP